MVYLELSQFYERSRKGKHELVKDLPFATCTVDN